MAKVGLTEQQIHEIISEEVSNWRMVNEESLKDVITKAIAANNEKVTEDVKKIVANVFQTI